MAEARRSERSRTLMRASIIFNNSMSTIDCQVRNFSAEGARIIADETMPISAHFNLDIPHKGRVFRARMIWRDGPSIGVEFLPDGMPEFADTRARKLDVENKLLRAQVNILMRRLESLGVDAAQALNGAMGD